MKRRLQVFISSTYTDLLLERQAAVTAVLKTGNIPAGMELFAAGDKSQMETIKHWIDESDVYMLILGGRYGSIEPTTGLSYTELEYDYALQHSKPLFAVVIREDALEAKVRSMGSAIMETQHSREMTKFREKVLSYTSSFFEDVKDIKLAVHESLADFSATRKLQGWVPADAVVDTQPLFEQISTLSQENRRLVEQVAVLEKQAHAKPTAATIQYDDLFSILKSMTLDLPEGVATTDTKTRDLFTIFHANRDRFVNGVTNSMPTSPSETFLYFKVCPKLQVHGLMSNESVTGAKYRRYAITREGAAFLAETDRRLLKTDLHTESI